MFHALKLIREAKHANHYVFLHPCHCTLNSRLNMGSNEHGKYPTYFIIHIFYTWYHITMQYITYSR